jgi:aspartyl-tRNA(Asn)/glutamyl-tRNA(Gln) amidotransferase subunit C
MSAFAADDVRRLAALARLELGPDEIDAFVRQLNDILEFARQVQSVDTADVTPDSYMLPPAPAVRDDATLPSLDRDEVLAAAPDADRTTGLFKVPRVLSG